MLGTATVRPGGDARRLDFTSAPRARAGPSGHEARDQVRSGAHRSPRPRRSPPGSIIVATVEGERATGWDGTGVGTVAGSGTTDAGKHRRIMPHIVRSGTVALLLETPSAHRARDGHGPT